MRVKYVGDENVSDAQVSWGNNDDPRGVLNTEQEYKVVVKDVHSWHTKYVLEGVEHLKFNSVPFESVD